MNDIFLESVRTIVLLGIVIYLWKAGKERAQTGQKGWWFILAGFFLLAVGSVVDITDNFEALNRFVIIGDTKAQAFLEKMISFLGGFVVLTIGLVRWIPTVANVHKIESLVEGLQRRERERDRAEEALRESEERFRLMVEGSEHVFFYRHDRTRHLRYLSPSVRNVLGYNPAEMLGQPCDVFLADGVSKTRARQETERGMEGGDRASPYTLTFKHKDGHHILGEVMETSMRPKGQEPYMQGFIRDDTERKRAEEERNAFARMATRLAATTTLKGMGEVIREETNLLLGWDAHYFAFRESGEEAFYVVSCFDTVDGEKRSFPPSMWPQYNLDAPLRKVLRGEPSLINRTREDPSPPSCRFGDKDRPSASLMFAPVRSGPDVIGVVSAQSYTPQRYSRRDLELLQRVADLVAPALERAHTEDKLRESEHRYRELVNRMRSGVAVLEAVDDGDDFVFVDFNQGGESIDSTRRDDLIGKRVTQVFPGVAEFGLLDVFQRVWRTGQPEHHPVRLYKDERITGWRENFVYRLPSGEVVTVYDDLTSQKQAEEEKDTLEVQLRQSQKMEAVGQLAGGMAHEFNNMLAVVLWNAEFLQARLDKDLPDEAETLTSLEQIIKASRRASDLTRQLLTLGRKRVVRPEILDLSALVGDAAKMLARLVGERIRLQTDLEPEVEPVWVDDGQIGQVLMNLVLNARDAMPDGGQITIETENVNLDEPYAATHVGTRAGPHVRLSVTDTGSGMDEEARRRMFEPFFTTKPVGQGTGLGLAVVFGIIEQAGGHITVDSQPGSGTTVTILFPVIDAGAAPTEQEEAVAKPSPAGPQTILVCEDEPMVRDPLYRVLRANGFTVIAAENGKHALEVAAAHAGPIDALIADVVMPEMQGPELAKALRERHPDLRVMYMSGYAPGEIKLEEGAKFVEKPCMPSTLLQHLSSLLNT